MELETMLKNLDMSMLTEKFKEKSRKEIEDFLYEYYDKESSASDVLEKFGIQISMVNNLLPFYKIDDLCRYCHTNLLVRFPSKTTYYSKYELSSLAYVCPNCEHYEYVNNYYQKTCTCSNCVKEMEKQKEEKERLERQNKVKLQFETAERIAYLKQLNNKFKVKDNTEIDLETRIKLCAYLRTYLSEDMSYIESTQKEILPPDQIARKSEVLDSLIEKLFMQQIILIQPVQENLSHINFEYDKNNKPISAPSFYPMNIRFILNVAKADSDNNLSEHLMSEENLKEFIQPDWSNYIKSDDDINMIYDMWLEELVEETANYTEDRMEALGFDFHPGSKTRSVLRTALEKITLNDVMAIIYSASKNVLSYATEQNMSRSKGKNLITSNIERMATRAINEKWTFRDYSRTKQNPLRRLPSILFSEILQLPKEGMNTVPCKEYIKDLYLND